MTDRQTDRQTNRQTDSLELAGQRERELLVLAEVLLAPYLLYYLEEVKRQRQVGKAGVESNLPTEGSSSSSYLAFKRAN